MRLRSGAILKMEARTQATRESHPREESVVPEQGGEQEVTVEQPIVDRVEEGVVVEVDSVRGDQPSAEGYTTPTHNADGYTTDASPVPFDLANFLASQFATIQQNIALAQQQTQESIAIVQQQTQQLVSEKIDAVQHVQQQTQQKIDAVQQQTQQAQLQTQQLVHDKFNEVSEQVSRIQCEFREVLADHSKTLTERLDQHVAE